MGIVEESQYENPVCCKTLSRLSSFFWLDLSYELALVPSECFVRDFGKKAGDACTGLTNSGVP